ncbi:MAG: lipocalin-like domain-containing protein [Deltaproteobacteria bacterium]|nr:MAG: lipocalin-like domain-containing protein [Deltaproteobacteria bacterium]
MIGLILLLAAPALELEASGGVAFPSPPHPAQGPKAAALQIRAGLDFLDHLQHGGQVMRVRDSVASGTGSTLSQALIGTWKLVSSEFHLSSGDVIHPYGNDAVGLLIYAEDGQMSAQIMRRGRPSFASGDVFGGTPVETKKAMDGVVSYFGSFAVDEAAGTVEHRVVGSVFPNWENETQVRYHELEGTHLTLRTAPLPAGQGITATGVLVWERTGARR